MKTLIWVFIIGALGWAGIKIFPVYYTNWKVQDVFTSITHNLSNANDNEIRAQLPKIFFVKYILAKDVPKEFYDNLDVRADGNRVIISSKYHITVWLLGPVEQADPANYDPSKLKGMDIVRHRLRYDVDFNPHADTTPN